jgi:hypothetical protein
MQEQHVAGGALDQSPDRGLVLRAGDEVSFPAAGHGSVFDFSGTLDDVDHSGNPAPTFRGPPRFSQPSLGSQAPHQLPAQAATPAHIEASVDGLVTHAHAGVVGEQQLEPSAELLRAVLGMQPVLHMLSQPVIDLEQSSLRATGATISYSLGDSCPVARLPANEPAAQLSAHSRG